MVYLPDTGGISLSPAGGYGIGLVVFTYGKKQGSLGPFIIGIALMAYPKKNQGRRGPGARKF